MHMMSKSTRAAAAAPNAMQRALSAAAAAKLPVPAFVRAAAYQVPFCPRLLPPGGGHVADASRFVPRRASAGLPPPRTLHSPLLLLFRHPLHLLLAPAAAKCHALPQLVGKGHWRPFHVVAAAALAGPSARVCAVIVRGMYMYMCLHAIFRNKATPLIVAPC